jgi:hypothetical protein
LAEGSDLRWGGWTPRCRKTRNVESVSGQERGEPTKQLSPLLIRHTIDLDGSGDLVPGRVRDLVRMHFRSPFNQAR